MANEANYIFLPWVQPGLTASLPAQATETLSAAQPAVASVKVKLQVNSSSVDKTASLYGPGDVLGIDPREVVRVEPRPATTDFEPNYFPAIEFDRPDFPWLFTPAKADTQGRLRPWLCLVIVRKQPGVQLGGGGSQLPVLSIAAPARPGDELPDLAESHLWAHAQVTGTSKAPPELKKTLESAPARTVSRLLCPRRLDPGVEYLACVVPAFEVGRITGLDLDITPPTTLEPAWRSGADAPADVRLPVYYSWEFRTGQGGDFEELVRRLVARRLPAEVGRRPLDIGRPGFALPAHAEGPGATVLALEGALRVAGAAPDRWADGARLAFQGELAKIVNTPWKLASPDNTSDADPIVAPPIVAPPTYGCWQAAVHTVKPADQWPPDFWLEDLNLDPRNRAVAAMGTQVVQEHQEALMASAWEQLGDIQNVNQRLRQGQLSRAVNQKYYDKTFKQLSDGAFVKIVAPAQSQIVMDDNTRLATKLEGALPTYAVSAPLRKVTRSRGAISRQYSTESRTGAAASQSIFNVFSPDLIAAPTARRAARDRGEVTIDLVSTGQYAVPTSQTAVPRRASSLLAFLPVLLNHGGRFTGSADVAIDEIDFTADSTTTDKFVLTRPGSALLTALPTMLDHRRIFSGENGILYGVDKDGRLLFYREKGPDGGGDLSAPTVIGFSGWLDFRFLFSGGDGIIYAVHQDGRLLFYRDSEPAGTGNVLNFTVVGPTNIWRDFTFLFSGGKGVIYAVDGNGHLLLFRDQKRDGTGPIANPTTINRNVWGEQNFRTVFSNGKGIYGVDHQGRLLFCRDETQDGLGVIGTPAVISPGGWDKFVTVFARNKGGIYAVDQLGRLLFVPDEKREVPANVGQDIVNATLQSLAPAIAVSRAVLSGVNTTSPALSTGDELDPIMDAPVFPQPMYEALRDLSPDLLFPGLEHVPPDTVGLLQTNSKFIESYMVGLNAEMSRELLWRDFPTDQRGTYFQQFWDRSGAAESQPDIPPIHRWGKRALGANLLGAGGERLVLLLRGDLLRRYPGTVIYAAKAEFSTDGRRVLPRLPEVRPALFRGTFEPDATFLGFNLTPEEAAVEPGWFFVLQEQPTEARFGMDAVEGTTVPALDTWNDLSWAHMAPTPEQLAALAHVSASKVQLTPTTPATGTWGRNSAHMAYITKQRPMRVAIHATELLLKTT